MNHVIIQENGKTVYEEYNDGNIFYTSKSSSKSGSSSGKKPKKDKEIDQLISEIDEETSKISVVFAIAALIVILLGILWSLGIIPRREYNNSDFGIEAYQSSEDKDNDGVDDQTDILAGARGYLETKPKYQSKYYASGYPDDEYGVCTDVIAFAMKGAGYDLMNLVDADIRQHPEMYDIETPDRNIDFRRVKNLEVWFRRNTQALTTDVKDFRAWQGGDVVIFGDHIGIISDKRNKDGISYLIHHYSPMQTTYEEDALEDYQDKITGHYRVS